MTRRDRLRLGLFVAIFCQCLPAFGEEAKPDIPLTVQAQFTYGMMGAARANHFLHDELIFIRHQSCGIATDPQTHQCDLAIEATLAAEDGSPRKTLTEFEKSTPYLGGGAFTGGFFLGVPELEAGSYSIIIKVHDRIANETAQAKLEFKIFAKDTFGIKNMLITQDVEKRIYANSFATTGEILHVHGEVVHYQVDMDQIDLLIEMKIIDDQGQAVFESSFTEQKAAKASRFSDTPVPYQFHAKLYTARPGRFEIVLTVHDLLAEKHYQQKMPLVVIDPFERRDRTP